MDLSRVARVVVISAAVVLAISALPETSNAVLSGTNGRIVFVSGRGAPADNTAKLYLRPTIGSIGAGTAQPIPGATGAGQHRHPTWSPDRTMIAYAHGEAATANFDIFVLDLTDPDATPQNITKSDAVTDDRPAWSPDGKKIAFESENADGSNQLNIKLYNVRDGDITNLTSTNSGTYEHKPAWTPDSDTLYYVTGNPTGTNMDIVKEPAAGGAPSNILADPTANEFQPSISPDGTRMCFTRGTGAGFNATARVRVALANGGGQMELPGNAGVPGYNCTWSPDGTKIAYVQGTFTTGDLVMENSDLSLGLLSLETTAGHFDGNPDWAPDGRPQCEDRTIFATVNTPISIPLVCEDTGPAYEQTEVRAFVGTEPGNGTVSPGIADPPVLLPGSVTYTPKAGFTGTDSFEVRSFDLVAFGDRNGTVTVNVQPPGQQPDDGPPPNDFTFGKVKKNKKKGTAKLTVNLPFPGVGALELAKSKKLKGDEKRTTAEGSVKLKARPRGKAKEKLAETGTAKVKAKVTFTPDGGDPNTKSKRVKLKRK